MRSIPVLAALALLSACATSSPPKQVNLAGFPPAFRAGYADGCQSAKPDAAKRRDEQRFRKDTQYASGWRDGYDICRRLKPQ
jgi:hypothetical protein